jgi:hypothetical protein
MWKDERAYLNWLRGQIRRIWSRHPIKHRYIQQRPSVKITKLPTGERVMERGVPLGVAKLSANTKEVKCCEMCDKWFPKGKMEVDHEVGGVGFQSYDEFLEWQHRMLFVSFDDIKHICKDCHHQVSMSQKFGCSLENVWVYQAIADFNKLKVGPMRKRLNEMGLKSDDSGPHLKVRFKQHMMEKLK